MIICPCLDPDQAVEQSHHINMCIHDTSFMQKLTPTYRVGIKMQSGYFFSLCSRLKESSFSLEMDEENNPQVLFFSEARSPCPSFAFPTGGGTLNIKSCSSNPEVKGFRVLLNRPSYVNSTDKGLVVFSIPFHTKTLTANILRCFPIF